jgi:hypothetical protein
MAFLLVRFIGYFEVGLNRYPRLSYSKIAVRDSRATGERLS